jgi:hypothetical protein
MSNLSDSQNYINKIKEKIKQKYPLCINLIKIVLKRSLAPSTESKYVGGLKSYTFDP